MAILRIPRRPRTPDELWWLIVALFGVRLPRVQVCPDHVSPFQAVCDAYFAKEPNYAVWYASRGSGKSLALAVLGLVKAFVDEVDVTLIGGSMVQSLNVRNHMTNMLSTPNAPRYALAKDLVTLIQTTSGAKIEPLPASQKTVRGKHPVLELLDEVDEMDMDIFDASLGQAMEQPSKNPAIGDHKLAEYVVASSTWQNPEGTFSKVIERARDNGHPIYSWCWRELLLKEGQKDPNEDGTWMSERFIAAKRKTVSAQMWKTEYELGEPSATSRAFDLDKVAEYFIDYPTPAEIVERGPDDITYTWERPEANGLYAVGADWAKEQDKTVITVVRYDIQPHMVVKAHVVNRRPWPVMIGYYNRDIDKYLAVGQHDKTGLGSVINDLIDNPDRSSGFVFVGRPRTLMLQDYVTEFENGRYRFPKQLDSYYRAHRGTTVADVYAPSKWDAHLPDEVASCALVNRAVKKMPSPVTADVQIPKLDVPPKIHRQFHVKPSGNGEWREEGVVTVVDEEQSGYSLLV